MNTLKKIISAILLSCLFVPSALAQEDRHAMTGTFVVTSAKGHNSNFLSDTKTIEISSPDDNRPDLLNVQFLNRYGEPCTMVTTIMLNIPGGLASAW